MKYPVVLIAPSLSVRLVSFIKSFGSISPVYPKPVHFGQAPCGLLNENSLGDNSSKETPQSGQAYNVEYKTSSPL